MSTYTKLFWFRIEIQSGKIGVDKPTVMLWQNLPWAVRIKWDWYFKYRAALAQVQHPRANVIVTWGNSEPDQRSVEKIRRDEISRQQAKVTKIKNLMFKARAEWNDLMPIEDHPNYIKAKAKLEYEQARLDELSRN